MSDVIDEELAAASVAVVGGAAAKTPRRAGMPPNCLSCGHPAPDAYCGNCGQKHDDMRRSTVVLAGDFLRDTFGFDARMWRTFASLAGAPGHAPAEYSHGKRSRYTPPVRLFILVSFLFFLVLAMTDTMFVAIEVKPAAISDDAAFQLSLGNETLETSESAASGLRKECALSATGRFFVRPQDITVDRELWAKCRDYIRDSVVIEIEKEEGEGISADEAKGFFENILAGISQAIEQPLAFNRSVNEWLPRVMFAMAPILALLLALFLRGRNALLFDHLVQSLYGHAVGFALVGFAVIGVHLGFANAFVIALPALLIYFLLSLKRSYKRGWIKTIYTGLSVSLLYTIILTVAVLAITTQVVIAAGGN